MKILSLILIALLLIGGCKTNPPQKPTPFETTEETIKLYGCEKLKERVKKWNDENPDKEPKVADC